MRFFNNAGPSVEGQHYMIDPLERLDLAEVLAMIEQQRYFVLHAPRQTGKTTSLLALMAYLNRQGRYLAVYANIEAAQALRHQVEKAMRTICNVIASSARDYGVDERLEGITDEVLRKGDLAGALTETLSRWARASERPTVLLLDEVDALVGDTLISLLRQIRSGYAKRPQAFPHSIILCGVRDVRDYRIHTSHQEIITGGSAFNIKATSLRLGNLSRQEVEALYQQHTQDTGQTFAPAIFPELWEDTRGQPWLVNALGYELTWHDRELRDRSLPIDLERYKAARERLIHSRATHLDQLTDKLREERVRRVVMTLMEGAEVETRFPEDDLQYVHDLGLIRRRPLAIANRIYQEILPREITSPIQDVITQETPWYVEPDQRLNMAKLLTAFQQFFREHSQAWLERFEYQEAGPQLLLQAFLQRIVNGGGRISREYGLGRRRTDLYLEWPLDGAQGHYGPVQRVVLELKILHKGLEATIAEGLEQTADYADRCGAEEAHLLIFDRREGVSWDEKIWFRAEGYQGREIQVWGC
jgi:hypothetical protein